MKTSRYSVRKLDFGRGYRVVDSASGREVGSTFSLRRNARALADRMNSKIRSAA